MFTNDTKCPRFLSILASLSALALGVASAGCAEPELVAAEANTVDRTIQPISIGDLESINGTYGAGCTARSGSWSLEISVGAALDNDELSVVKNDTGCELTLTLPVTRTVLIRHLENGVASFQTLEVTFNAP